MGCIIFENKNFGIKIDRRNNDFYYVDNSNISFWIKGVNKVKDCHGKFLIQFISGKKFQGFLHVKLSARKNPEIETREHITEKIREILYSFTNEYKKAEENKRKSEQEKEERKRKREEEELRFTLPTGIRGSEYNLVLVSGARIGWDPDVYDRERLWVFAGPDEKLEYRHGKNFPPLDSISGKIFATKMLEELLSGNVSFTSPKGERWWLKNLGLFIEKLQNAVSWESKKLMISEVKN